MYSIFSFWLVLDDMIVGNIYLVALYLVVRAQST